MTFKSSILSINSDHLSKSEHDLGVSVVICTYNGAKRLPQTLSHLAHQRLDRAIDWEVVVVNNASTDNTKEVAFDCWRGVTCAELRVVDEPKLGVSNARRRGFEEALYDIVSFVDDDNWVCPDWVQMVSEVMTGNPEIGACGSRSEAVFEAEPPEWFEDFRGSFAVGSQGDHPGDVTEDRGWFWAAGLSVRKQAWRGLVDKGFRFHVLSREGNKVTGSEDVELCCALRLTGSTLWYEPSLLIQHYIPERRLNWNYLLDLYRGVGLASAKLDGYNKLLEHRENTLRNRLRYTWKYQALAALKMLIEHSIKKAASDRNTIEYRKNDCSCKFHTSRLLELLKMRKAYDHQVREIASVNWSTNRVSV